MFLINIGCYVNSCFEWDSPQRSICAFLVRREALTRMCRAINDIDVLICTETTNTTTFRIFCVKHYSIDATVITLFYNSFGVLSEQTVTEMYSKMVWFT